MLMESAAGFPSGILDVYASYKRGTARVVRWLSSNSDHGVERPYLTSIRELRYFADCVMLKGIEVPDELIHTFRQAVQARKQLTGFYKRCSSSCDEATESHAYFNGIFEDVYRDLSRFRKPKATNHFGPQNDPPASCIVSGGRRSNRYSYLESVAAEPGGQKSKSPGKHEDFPAPGVSPTSDPVTSQPDVGRGRETERPAIEGDALDEITYLFTHLLELDHLMSTIKQSYRDVARGSIPLAVAATTTNATYECGKALCAGLQKYGIRNPAQFKDRYFKLMGRLNMQDSPRPDIGADTTPKHLLLTRSMGPQLAWETLCRFKKARCEADSRICCDKCGKACAGYQWRDPAEILGLRTVDRNPEAGGRDDAVDRTCLETILQGVYQTLRLSQSTERPPGLLFNAPLVRDLLAFLEDDNPDGASQVNHCGLCFGLHLLLESYRSFCGADCSPDGPSPQTIGNTNLHARTPRLQSLKFAIDVKTKLGRIMDGRNIPCECLKVRGHCVASLLVGCHSLLDNFIVTKRFDIYYQAPWVSGEHILENLARASDYGSRAWHWGYLVGTVLHLYNALVQLERLEQRAVPILDALCDIFEDSVFLGKRSTHNVLACWQRWAGGKIKQPPHRSRSITSVGTTDKKWHICNVPDVSQGGNNESRSFSPAKISLFSLLTEVPSALDDKVAAWIYLPEEKRRKPQTKDISRARTLLDEDGPLARYVERIQATVLDEFRTLPVPVARINYIAIYDAAIQTMRRISVANHDEDPGHICKCPAEMCLRECDAALKRRLVASGKKAPGPARQPYCDSCLQHLVAVFEGKSIGDFLWNL